jgi:RNA polymerase sigma-70 factor (ECF subfamily)
VAELRPDSTETVRLLNSAAAGDRAAVDALLTQHRDPLRAFIACRLDPAVCARLDQSDVVQEALADTVRRLPDYLARRPMPFHLWARKTAYERVLKARRAHRAERRDVAREAAAPDQSSLALARSLVCGGPSPSQVAEATETADRVARALGDLAESDREMLLLRQVDCLPYEEIGLLLDIDATAARKRYGRALIRLEKTIAAHGLSGDVS